MLSKTTGMNPVVADFFNIGNLAGGFGPKLKPVKDMAVGGNKWARARVISKAIDKGTPSVEPLPNNVGWGPRQSIHVVHDKNSARLPKLYFPERWDARDEVPSAVPTELQGYLQGEKGMYPVFTQTKVGPIEKENVLDELAKIFESKGWTRINDSSYKNSKITVGDITTENVGMLNGKPVIFDPEAAYNKDIIRVSNAKFKNKNN